MRYGVIIFTGVQMMRAGAVRGWGWGVPTSSGPSALGTAVNGRKHVTPYTPVATTYLSTNHTKGLPICRCISGVWGGTRGGVWRGGYGG